MRDLTVRYGVVEAVREATLRVDEGEIVALVGPNGAGKTSLLSAIVGLVPAVAGNVTFNGHEVRGRRTEQLVRDGMSLVPEHRRLFADLTVHENILMGASARTDRVAIDEDVERLSRRFPILAERQSQMAGFLSGGEAQQLAIARALMNRPKLLLLDEPSLGLAPIIVRDVFRLLEQLRADGQTMLVVDQNAHQALALADRVYVMNRGELHEADDAEVLATEEGLVEAYMGTRQAGRH